MLISDANVLLYTFRRLVNVTTTMLVLTINFVVYRIAC